MVAERNPGYQLKLSVSMIKEEKSRDRKSELGGVENTGMNRMTLKEMKKAKGNWIENLCQYIETCLSRNNTMKAKESPPPS